MWWIPLFMFALTPVTAWIVGRIVARAIHSKYAKTLREMTTQVVTAAEAEATARRRADGYFQHIEGIEAECKEWKRLYYAEASMHGKAQQLLFGQLGSLAKQYYAATKKKPQLSPLIEQVIADYSGQHPTKHPPAPAPPLQEPGPETPPPVVSRDTQ